MLNLNKITKIYRPKGQPEVVALDGVNLTLPDKGLAFILGKSGSGKSTLLNILGGLDGCDGGETAVDSKSTAAFTQAEYDDFRNRYVGIIFQEYNLIESYTVAQNLSLALELQGAEAKAEATKEEIAEALAAVDMAGYEGRKASQLSGGQKQRIAIARAIVKKPKLILADEPTGNLDEKTGGQILELLKKLSKNTLIVAVTHDRNSAERYGDRIIEIADGKIAADTASTASGDKDKTEGRQNDGSGKKPAKRRGLPLKSILKLSLGNIKQQPLRLAVTLVLFTFSLTMLGVALTAAFFDELDFTGSVYNENNVKGIELKLLYTEDFYYYDEKVITDGFLSKLQRELPDYHFLKIYEADYTLSNLDGRDINYAAYYDRPEDAYIVCFESEEHFANYNIKMSAGELPQNENEIAITEYQYEVFKEAGIIGYDVVISDYVDILGVYLNLNNGKPLKIVGVMDTGLPDRYDSLKELPPPIKDKERYDYYYALKGEFNIEILSGLHKSFVVHTDYFTKPTCAYDYQYPYLKADGTQGDIVRAEGLCKSIDGVEAAAVKATADIVFKTGVSFLSKGQLVLPKSAFEKLVRNSLVIDLIYHSSELSEE